MEGETNSLHGSLSRDLFKIDAQISSFGTTVAHTGNESDEALEWNVGRTSPYHVCGIKLCDAQPSGSRTGRRGRQYPEVVGVAGYGLVAALALPRSLRGPGVDGTWREKATPLHFSPSKPDSLEAADYREEITLLT